MSQTALITGASSGLGLEYARLFAADKHDIVIVARRRERLDSIAAELQKAHGIRAHVVAADLGTPDGASRVVAEVKRLGLEVDFLVNNAGFGTRGDFSRLDAAREAEQVQVNVAALVTLTRAFLPAMLARRRGRVLNIGSTAGFQAGPYMAVYYATKAFVNSFTEGIAYEVRGSGVTATVSCPGATATEFAEVAGTSKSRLFAMGASTAADVAREGYRAMIAGRAMTVHGLKNKFATLLVRFTPRAIARAVAASLNRVPETKALPPAA
jgi:short-subunit dehydrogenase